MDKFASDHGESRSSTLHREVTLLRNRDLGDQYEAAWAADGAAESEATTADGLAF